ncbi:hypothetical protein AYM40_10080 [Paraburkholderia phytofirmans OLGA172]|uniref:Uncharacterized protein n=1 Tax=Paraburkholderia phytofirmans OLGA172 TaxID=1417228 RepID=A0A160FJX1_9BURK|nr:hypothetical protein AYM40_10080 [Paraburkholderia phytofirmans OLGA172]
MGTSCVTARSVPALLVANPVDFVRPAHPQLLTFGIRTAGSLLVARLRVRDAGGFDDAAHLRLAAVEQRAPLSR